MRLNLIFSFLIFVFFTGCTVNNLNQKTTDDFGIKTETKIEKKIEYIREPISEDLKLFIKNLMKTFSKHDIEQINKKFINPSFGFYNLYKVEGNEIFTFQKEIYNVVEDQTDELCHMISRVESEAKDYVIIEQDIKFDCSPNDDTYYGWNGDGLYLSNKTKTLLSQMMLEANKYQENKYSIDELNKAYFIEKMAYKVILTPDIIVYVNKIDNKWYITLFDRITTDCSSPEELENLDTVENENLEETKKEDKK